MISTILTIGALAIIFGIVLEIGTILIGVIGVAGYYIIKYALLIGIVWLIVKCVQKLQKKEN